MKRKITHFLNCRVLFCLLLLLHWGVSASAQLTNYQQISTKCYTSSTASMDNTTGTLVGNVGFTTADIPLGYKIVDVIVEIVWSKTDDGSCTSITGIPADASDVGFVIQAPFGPIRYLAASDLMGPFVGTTSSFMGLNNTIQDTIVFQDGGNPMLPAGLPVLGRDTVHPNPDALHFYCGNNPHGLWSVGGIDDAPSRGPKLCIHSYCITIISCDPVQLNASCKANPVVGVGATGLHSFEFPDLDSISDVSCLVEDITFSPSTINCSDVGSSIPVTMTIRDHLDSVESCISLVTVVDDTPPVISQCTPNILATLYLDATGRDTFLASSILATDNCGPFIKQVRPLSGGAWGSFVPINCLSGLQQLETQVIDSSGNIATCNITLNVIDTIRPTAVCGQDTAYLSNNPNGAVSVSALSVDGGSFDLCPPIVNRWIGSYLAPPPMYTCADIGTKTLRLIVADASGNLDTCDNAFITILDTLKPTAIGKNIRVYLNSSGIATVFANDVDSNSMDTCGIDSMNINGFSSIQFDCSHVNNNQQATLNVFDASGNTDSSRVWIMVVDTFPPIANCRNLSIYLDGTGRAIVPADSLNNGSIDLCTGNNLSFEIGGNPTITLNCSNLNNNPNPTILTVRDNFGNSSTCTASITVLDTIAPIISCRTPNVYLNASGVVTVTAADLSAGSIDNCGVTDSFVNILGNPFIRFNCFSLFNTQSARLIVEDGQGNTATCLASVNVIDTISPLASCKTGVVAQLDATGIVRVFPAAIDSNSTDNCSLVGYLINNSSSRVYTCADLGTQSVNLTVRDSSGNIATCTTQITIQDRIAPTVACQATTIYLGTTGSVSISPLDVLIPPVGDNCTTYNSTFVGQGSNILYTCDSIGTHSVLVAVSDSSGNTATCSTTIEVFDTISPIANCQSNPYRLELDATGNAFVRPQDIDNGSTDNCGMTNSFVNGMDSILYSCADVGTTPVTLLVLDASGNLDSCRASIVVNDSISPIALCQDTTVYLNSAGVASIQPNLIDAGSSDNCSFITSVNGAPSVNLNCNQLGMNTVQLIVIDAAGNAGQCTADVTLWDTIAPMANCIGAGTLNVYLDNSCFVTIPATTIDNGSTDNCSGPLTYTIGGLSNVTFNATNLNTNPNTISLSVEDIMGNSATCATTIIVRDSIRPIAICKNDTVYLNSNGVATVFANDINNSPLNTCGIDSLNINGFSSIQFNCSHVNNNQQATLNVFDASGNADSCTAWIHIIDTIPPMANCRNLSIYLDATGTVIVPADSLNNGSIDLCTGNNLSFEIAGNPTIMLDCSNMNSNPNLTILSVIDSFGNSSTCSAALTVLDTIAPLVSCQNASIYLNTSGIASLSAADLSAGSTDNCGVTDSFINVLGNAFSNFDCTSIFSPQTATLIVEDGQGNTATCLANVDVIDSIPPIALCKTAIVAQLDTAGMVSLLPTALDSNSMDNCGIVEYLINNSNAIMYTCADLGMQTATLTVRDSSGQTATCTTSISIEDTIAPVVLCQAQNLYLNSSGIVTIQSDSVLVFPATHDNCGIANSTFSTGNSINYTCDSIGTRSVEVVVTDLNGNIATCTSSLNIVDTIAPTANCRPVAFVLHLDSTGVGCMTPLDINNASTDLCSLDTMLINGVDSFCFNCTNLGANTVTLSVFDGSGNQSTCNTNVFVNDIISPTALCQDTTIYLNATGVATLFPADVDLGSSDNCAFSTSLNNQNSINYTCLDVGINTVQLLVVDNSGNTSQCTANVTILDTIAPTAICQNDTLYFSGAAIHINATSLDAGSNDNCALQSFVLSQDSFDCLDIGVNAITLTVVDAAGNSSTCIANINIIDTTVLAAAGVTQLLCASDSTSLNAMAAPSQLIGTWTTNSGATIVNPNAENSPIVNLPVGSNVFYWTLSNATCNNLSSDSVVIDVLPTSPDIANAGLDQNLCQDTFVTLNASAINTSTGEWQQTTAQSNAGVVIINPNDTLTMISGLIPGNAYTFVWELTNGLCGVYTSDTVIITIDNIPSDQADAGPDVLCSPDTIDLAANFSIMGGLGEWSTPSTALIEDSSSATSMTSNFLQDTSRLIWSLSNGVCLNYSSDTMYVILGDVVPLARMDHFDLIPDGTISTIDVISNDSLPSNWNIFIQRPSIDALMTNLNNGQFDLDINGVFLDQSFVYEICNNDCPDVCDTALVTIAIQAPEDCYVPTAFTPNNDGQNDFFVIPCLQNSTKRAGLAVFNRWGNLVYRTDDYNSTWDGTHQNQALPDGVYFYILEIKGEMPQNGSIEIKR